jgi:photosystem II stability/assembly factor-like uncharacterized protein
VGDKGTILQSSDGGKQWKTVELGLEFRFFWLRRLSVIPGDHAFQRSEAMIVGRAARAGACLRSGRAHGSIRASFAGVLTESAGEGITRLDAPID